MKIQWRCSWIFILLLMCINFKSLHFAAPDGVFILSVPKSYTAFSGDLHVNYSAPTTVSLPNAYIRLLSLTGKVKSEITTRSLETGKPSGQIRITCGEIEYAGHYIIELHMYVGGPLLNTTTFTVEWPKIKLLLPSTHLAQTKPLTLLYTSEAVCKSLVRRHLFHLDLEYTKNDDRVQSSSFSNIVFEIKDSKPFDDIDNRTGKITFSCESFDAAGRYIAVLRNSFDKSEVIAHSNVVDVRWSTAYRISIYSSSIFPCGGHLTVKYVQPTCPGNSDRIRMYFLRRTLTGSPAVPLDRVYITEKPAYSNQSSVLFPCSTFDLKAVGYCFVYANMAKDGAVTEQDDVCISAHQNTVLPIDGDWSGWSEWSSCSRSCGTGKQSRGRTCSDPKPESGGRFCEGFPVEWKLCDIPCPDLIPNTPLSRNEQEYPCGRLLENSTGEIIGTGRCKGLAQWTISVTKGHLIILTFKYFNILTDEQWLRVRDGERPNDALLAQTYGRIKPSTITSTGNKLLIQLMTQFNSSKPIYHHMQIRSLDPLTEELWSEKLNAYGFIATYKSVLADNSSVVYGTIPLTSGTETSIWESTVTIAGIALCFTVIVILSALAIYHRVCYRKKHKYRMAAHEETPTHIAKSTSMQSTPSHHSALSGVEIDYDMERPLTGNGKKKDNGGGRVSRGSSISSNKSTGYKMKIKAAIERSPKPILKQYSPIASPKIKTMKEDDTDKSSLFNTSPILNRKPRSPKIHPSPRFKHTSKVKTPTSPDTKYDLLIKRRKSKTEKIDIDERIVPGSDNTPVIEEKPISSTKSPESQDGLTPTNAKSPCVPNEQKVPERVDIPLVTLAKNDETRNPASGASDESSSPDNNEKTTSFIASKHPPPRPTSLTEIHKKFPSSSSMSSEKRRRMGERNKGLPQPDGESPKSSLTQSSKTSTPKSVHSSTSKLALSPSRSIASENFEMEYDDFIDYDDPLSYFDPEELEKLKWKGVEKISPKSKDED